MATQLTIPLFGPDTFDKIRKGYALIEMEKMRAEIEHLKHQRAGHIGAYKKLKQQINNAQQK